MLTAIAPNLVEGREFNNPQAIALDTSVTPPILYVADFGNNRVLGVEERLGFYARAITRTWRSASAIFFPLRRKGLAPI